jgi:multidrug efflux pump subunit AcrB
MSIFQFIIRQGRIFTLLVIILPIVAGVYAYQALPKEGDPEISAPYAIIITPYPGASPSEIESLVTNPLEEELSGIKNVDEIRSSSAESVSVIVIDFEIEADLEDSLQKVREKVTDARKDLPDDVEDSTVQEVTFSDIPIMLVSVVGDLDPVQLKRLAEDVADELELLPEVLSTDVAGGMTREIQIYLDPERLNQYDLTILDVFNAVKQADINIPGGMVDVSERRFMLRTLTEIKRVEDYEQVPLISQGNRVLFLKDVATIKDGRSEDVSYSRVDGNPSVSISVKKRTGANILETSEKVRQRIDELEKDFPAGVSIFTTADQAKYIKQSFDQMNNSAITGLIIVILVLYFAMGMRNSVITSLSIPLSLLVTFILLNVFGQTNNNMVRFALVLCIGLLVDNAIIVVENVYHHYQLGKDRLAAVIEGTSEIAAPVISATLTTMSAFLPMLLMTGTTGEYMGYLPKTVTIALSASLIVALIANPLVLARFMKRSVKKGRIVRPEEDLARLKRIYVRAVSWALNHRIFVVFFMILSLVCAMSLVGLKLVEVEMFPDIDFDYTYITIETPPGTDVDITDDIARQVEKIVNDFVPEAVQVVSTVGAQGQSAIELTYSTGTISNYAEVTLELLDGKEYARASHKEIQQRIRPYLEAIPGADISFRALEWGPPTDSPILVKVIGPELDELRRISGDLTEILSGISGAVEIEDDLSGAPPELRVEIDRASAAYLGVPMDSVAMTLRAATAGLDIREFRDELDVSKEYDLKVRFSPESRTSPSMLEKVKVRSGSGDLVPLSNIAGFSQGPGVNSIDHVDRHRVVQVTAQNEDRSAVEITKELMEKLEDYDLPDGYRFDLSGEYEETEESFASLKLAYLVAFMIIFTLLVTQFNSFFQPLAIMTALPMSIVGAMFGLLITGNNFSIMGFIGLVGLTGIVVNDSIVLVDCINRMRQKGMNIFNAILAAGQQRLRPIISTTLSTIGSIITLTITDKLWEGLGVVIIFGIAFATDLTLIVVPVMYSLFEGFGYYVMSALRGPRWTEAPQGKSFFFTRRRYARLWLLLILIIQIAVLGTGFYFFGPKFTAIIESTIFRAPSMLKLGIEILVFVLGFSLRLMGMLLILMLPFWLGLVWLMGRRSDDGRYVDVTPEGVTITSPTERLSLPASEIDRVDYSRIRQRLSIRAGKRRVRIKGVIEAQKTPSKVSLVKWLSAKAPSRGEISNSMVRLKESIEELVAK